MAVIADDLATESFDQDEYVGVDPLTVSSDGRRFGAVISEHRGGSALLDIGFQSIVKRIMVFDVPSRRWIFTLNAKKQGIKTISGLALSPDGALMAILTNGVVEVYRLPPEQPGKKPAPQQ